MACTAQRQVLSTSGISFLSFCEDKKNNRSSSASSKHDCRNTTEDQSIWSISDACLWKNGGLWMYWTEIYTYFLKQLREKQSVLHVNVSYKAMQGQVHCIICTMHINGDICSIYSQNLLKHNHIVCSFVSSTHQAMYMMYN